MELGAVSSPVYIERMDHATGREEEWHGNTRSETKAEDARKGSSDLANDLAWQAKEAELQQYRSLCLCLTGQIEKEAKTLLLKVPDIGVQHVVGGTNMNAETKRLNSQRCDILVATPGRLLDHINNGGLREKLSDLKILVLDEADRMLDMGFRNELEKIKANLPDRRQKPRQSLLFSATYPSR